MLTDIEIAQSTKMKRIVDIAKELGIEEDEIELYGKYKAKIETNVWERVKDKKDGKLILVTAVNPTPAGEGKTTTTVGLGQAMAKIGQKAIIALREPSLGPSFGVKGGAAGGGYSQVLPMEDINLHFTGDMHAITTAHALLSAALDNHLHQGNGLNIDPRQIVWKRAVDMNDRALRNIVVGLGGKVNGVPREDGFIITVASEIMAILCLSQSLMDLKYRLGRIIVGYTYEGTPVTAEDLEVEGAMALVLKDAIKPNLVQTTENTPCLIHGGPFANIAHGCNSVIATKLGLKLSDYLITEAGFGADLGAEKFFDIKCRLAGLIPNAVVLVSTIRTLKYNGGVKKDELKNPNIEALKLGICNLEKHIENLKKYGVPAIVSLNLFESDTEEEIDFVRDTCRELGAEFVTCKVFGEGGEGGIELAKKVVEITSNNDSQFKPLYELDVPIKEKIETIVKEIYGGKDVLYSNQAETAISKIEELGLTKFPICIAKTQYSLSDNPTLLGRPKDFTVTVKEIKISAGAGFIVAITGDIMTMPGLPKVPAANNIDIDEDGIITGLF